MPSNSPVSLWDLSRIFLKLGFISFGGPVAHIALMEDELVRKRKWISPEHFLDFIGAVNLIPGPNSTEIALHVGYSQRRLLGLAVAGISFIVPSFLMVLGLAALYRTYGQLPEVSRIMHFIQALMMAIILNALFRLFRTLARSRMLILTAVFTAVIHMLGIREVPSLFMGAVLPFAIFFAGNQKGKIRHLAIEPFTIFLIFLKIGSIIFGSGYVLFAFLKGEFVDRLGWITDHQLLDAISAGQITPGPLFTSATFIGYLLQGYQGALAATVGIFIPAFFFVAISGALIPKIRSSSLASTFLDGLNAASLGLMATVSFQLARVTLIDTAFWLIFAAASIWIFKPGRKQWH